MSEILHEVAGNFRILWSFDEAKDTETYEIFLVMEDLIRIALEDGHLKVKDVRVTEIVPGVVLKITLNKSKGAVQKILKV